MGSFDFSGLSSLRGEPKLEDFIQPHYKESYRLAIDRLLSGGRDSYQEFLKGERIGSFLSEDEILFITENSEKPPPQNHEEEINGSSDTQSSSGTYWPIHSDVETPDLDLGWPDVMHENLQTNIDLLFHPARQNSHTIKEVVRKKIQEARQVVGIVMDVFTDVDIFKEAVDASLRGVPVYILLDASHLKSFLTMAENQDVKIQQLRNMRVRTVKGQDYLCQSGAKFHGAMEQRFLLVDCLTAVYGSYSFSWSFEKINLSMVQVITGHLVKSYDEEFRTLYARSTVPVELYPDSLQRNGSFGRPVLPKSHSAGKIERRDQLRHTLDTVYRKTCERKLGTRDFEERPFEDDGNQLGPLIENGIGGLNQMPSYQSTEAMNFLKRHSYAGERQDGPVPQNIRPRASNWNISREAGNGINNYPMDNYMHMPQIYRGQNLRQSYSGNDKQITSMQQNMPSLENTSKSFMRTLRIESYLKNSEVPYRDSSDHLDQFEPTDKASSFMQGRLRTSLAFRSTIPEQMEPNRHMNNSSTHLNSPAAQNTPMHYSSMQWTSTPAAENRMTHDDFMLKRQSLQMLDDSRNNTSLSQSRNSSYHSVYSGLNRPKGGHMITNPDIMNDSWNKRHSVADPRSNVHEPTPHLYGAYSRMQANRSTTGINTQQNGGYVSNLNEDQRSVSHYDVKSITSTKSPTTPSWQEPPSRTVSAAVLDLNSKDSSSKSHSHHFLKKSTKKIKSLLHIPEKKEGSISSFDTQSWKSGTSTDTITGEDEETSHRGAKSHHSTTSSVRSPSVHSRNLLEDSHLKPSKPRFGTEEQRNTLQNSRTTTPAGLDKSTRTGLDAGSWSKDRNVESRLYSRFEPFCSSVEKKHPLRTSHSFGAQEKTKVLPKVEFATDHHLSRASRGPHENKLEKLIHRFGNLIHKNK